MTMGNEMFRALVLHEEGGKVVPQLESLDEARLPAGEVTVRVEYSTLNYKDGMILQGIGRLVRQYPLVPGIDFAGTVEASESAEYKPGDPVILTGWRVGEVHWGGFAEKARVPASFLVPRPPALSARQTMAIGTAGFTAMLAVIALERHGLTPAGGDVLVTGAAGGVGSVAVSLLSALGYRVAAGTGRPELRDYLESLGAAELVERAALAAKPTRPLDRELGRSGRRGRRQYAGDNPDPAQIPRQRRRLRPCRRQRLAGQCYPVSVARREPAGDRFGHVSSGRANRCLATVGARPAVGSARPAHQAGAVVAITRACAANPQRRCQGAHRRRRHGLSRA
jgi:threonine dehydrogenase-like Zn-dependent dehydrogenase